MSASSDDEVWTPPEAPDGVDEQKAKKLMDEIVDIESKNEKKPPATKSSGAEMVQKIALKIQSEVKC